MKNKVTPLFARLMADAAYHLQAAILAAPSQEAADYLMTMYKDLCERYKNFISDEKVSREDSEASGK